MKNLRWILILIFLWKSQPGNSQSIYFPPLNNNAPWDTLSPQSLGWCTDKIDSLYQYLEGENTKAFLVLKNGKIVLEKYFGTFQADSVWYWASAAKTLNSFLIGKAQEENFLKLSDTTSRYLGQGWTAEPPTKERKITIRNQLTMTTGLDDGVPDNHCTIDTCLQYLADAGTRWAYHNAPYTLLGKVIENATSQTLNVYTQLKLKNQTGITGIWRPNDYDVSFYSKPRAMARFGILAQNKFNWNGTPLLTDTAYIRQSTNTSQNLNKSYGYLWWLNGKSSFMVPGLQTVFPGSLAPNAPADMFAALGKNGQILSIVPSTGILFVRMGSSNTGDVPFTFCNEIWVQLNKVICTNTATAPGRPNQKSFSLVADPGSQIISLASPEGVEKKDNLWLDFLDLTGRIIREGVPFSEGAKIHTGFLAPGIYQLRIQGPAFRQTLRFVKN